MVEVLAMAETGDGTDRREQRGKRVSEGEATTQHQSKGRITSVSSK